jgi:hypothetical protein
MAWLVTVYEDASTFISQTCGLHIDLAAPPIRQFSTTTAAVACVLVRRTPNHAGDRPGDCLKRWLVLPCSPMPAISFPSGYVAMLDQGNVACPLVGNIKLTSGRKIQHFDARGWGIISILKIMRGSQVPKKRVETGIDVVDELENKNPIFKS